MRLLFAVLLISVLVLLGSAIAGYVQVRRYRQAVRLKRERGGPDTVSVDVKRELNKPDGSETVKAKILDSLRR